MNFYGALILKNLEILHFSQYAKIYEQIQLILQSFSASSHKNYEIVNPEDFVRG